MRRADEETVAPVPTVDAALAELTALETPSPAPLREALPEWRLLADPLGANAPTIDVEEPTESLEDLVAEFAATRPIDEALAAVPDMPERLAAAPAALIEDAPEQVLAPAPSVEQPPADVMEPPAAHGGGAHSADGGGAGDPRPRGSKRARRDSRPAGIAGCRPGCRGASARGRRDGTRHRGLEFRRGTAAPRRSDSRRLRKRRSSRSRRAAAGSRSPKRCAALGRTGAAAGLVHRGRVEARRRAVCAAQSCRTGRGPGDNGGAHCASPGRRTAAAHRDSLRRISRSAASCQPSGPGSP